MVFGQKMTTSLPRIVSGVWTEMQTALAHNYGYFGSV
jgi:hypothetical protein